MLGAATESLGLAAVENARLLKLLERFEGHRVAVPMGFVAAMKGRWVLKW